MSYANPKPGIYVSTTGKIFVLWNQDGPYPLADEPGEVSTYTYEDETGKHPKTVIMAPFHGLRLDSLRPLTFEDMPKRRGERE